MKWIKKKIDKLPLTIRSIIYAMLVSTCVIAVVIFLLAFVYLLYSFLLNKLATIIDPVVSIFLVIWILMTIIGSIVIFVESKR